MSVQSRITEDARLLLEREEELAARTGALDAARPGEGSLLVVTGAAGTGKSALVAVAASRARERALGVRRGRGSELEQELSFGLVRQLFEPVLRTLPPERRAALLSGAAAA